MANQITIKRNGAALDFRSLNQFDDHHMVICLNDDRCGLKAYVAIHSIHHGIALGGTRIKPYANNRAALQDVLDLSSAMTYKCALAGLPYGGGKAVIMMDEGLNRTQIMKSYAHMIQELRGLFKTGTDVGVTDKDVIKMARFTDHMLGVSEADRGDMHTSTMAALGVFYGVKAALLHTTGSNSLKGKSIAIKGLGKLGSELARLAYNAGAEVIGADTDEAQCRRIRRQLPGIKIVSSAEIHKQAVDIYAPCALGGEFTTKTINELGCRMIVGGANNQLANERMGGVLFEKGILYAPDYIANAGGLIYVADELEPRGFNKTRVTKRVKGIEDTLKDVFEQSKRKRVAPHIIADRIARERVKAWSHGK